MAEDQLPESVLLRLAALFEAGKGYFAKIEECSIYNNDEVRGYLSLQVASGFMRSEGVDLYQLTPEGYRFYLPRIEALRARLKSSA